MRLSDFKIEVSKLESLANTKLLINTINAHSFNLSKKDKIYCDSLSKSDVLLPDGISVVWALRWLKGLGLKKIAGADLFKYEMERIQSCGGKCFFMGSSENTVGKIKARALIEYPAINVECFSPPFRNEFTEEENKAIISRINEFEPDVLFIGMTAPKQEKWAARHFEKINAKHICCIGAVFDFYAQTLKRAPKWMISIGMEWFYRFLREPRRMWKRYLVGNMKFIFYIFTEKFFKRVS